jgi:SAM-dependent methyltransferase
MPSASRDRVTAGENEAMDAQTSTPSRIVDVAAASACRESWLGRQFGQPAGFAGALIGRLMAVKNARMSRLAVERLAIEPGDAVLEIGFGPGRALARAARRVTTGYVAGIDHSPLMVRQAARRNRRSMERGRVEIRLASVVALPFESGCFTKVFEVNTFHHWPDRAAGLREVRRVMAEGALLLLCLRMNPPVPRRFAAPGYSLSEVADIEALLHEVGFGEIRQERHRAGREVTCLFARR